MARPHALSFDSRSYKPRINSMLCHVNVAATMTALIRLSPLLSLLVSWVPLLSSRKTDLSALSVFGILLLIIFYALITYNIHALRHGIICPIICEIYCAMYSIPCYNPDGATWGI